MVDCRVLSTAPLLVVVDDAVSSEDCELLIATSKRRAPQVVTSKQEEKPGFTSSSTTMHNYQLPTTLASRTADETAALERVSTLVERLLQCTHASGETQTVRRTESSATRGLSLGLHVDTNLKPRRFATALLYLRDVPHGGGGETVFPLCGLAVQHPVAAAAQALIDAGCSHTRRPPADLQSEADMLRMAALRTLARAQRSDVASADGEEKLPLSGGGIAVSPRRGRLVLFFSRRDDGEVDGMSWHGGADCTAEQEKWTLQLFKEVPEEVADVASYVCERRAAFRL